MERSRMLRRLAAMTAREREDFHCMVSARQRTDPEDPLAAAWMSVLTSGDDAEHPRRLHGLEWFRHGAAFHVEGHHRGRAVVRIEKIDCAGSESRHVWRVRVCGQQVGAFYTRIDEARQTGSDYYFYCHRDMTN